MKRYLSFVFLMAASLMLAGCNLFIEDDYVDENGFKNVPEHDGDGYDKPVTVMQGDCEVTYQYKKNVRVITPEQQKQWVVYAEKDATGAFIEVHFRGDTPSGILPVPGEILVSTVTEFFPWGCNHLLQRRDYEDGVYIFQGVFSPLEDTYEDLRIEGMVTDMAEEEYYVYPMPEEEEEYEENTSGEDEDNPAGARKKVSFEVEGVKVTLDSDKFGFRIPFTNAGLSKGPLSVGLDMSVEKNYYEVTTRFDFSGFDLSKGNLKAKVEQTTEMKLDFNITGSINMPGSQRLHRWQPLQGKAVIIGPVVIVFFINIDLELQLSINAAINVTKHNVSRTTYIMDFKKFTLDKEEKTLVDEDWKFGDLQLEGTIRFIFKVHLGMGIYGKILSVRVIPALTAEVNFALPKATMMHGNIVWDVSEHQGVSFKLYFSVTLGVYLDLSLKKLLGGEGKQMSASEQRKKLKELEDDAKEKSKYFQEVADELNKEFDPNKKYYVNDKGKEKEMSEGDDEIGISHTFGPWQILDPPPHIPWFPIMGSSTYHIIKQWDEERKEIVFTAEYKIWAEGLLSALGLDLLPAIQLWNGSELMGYVLPKEGGENAKLEEYKWYQFRIPAAEEDVTYTAKPCYFKRGELDSTPLAVDKGLPFSAYSPSIAITDVDPMKVRPGLAFGSDTWYTYDFDINIIIALKGGMNVSEFGFHEANYIEGNVYYDPKKSEYGQKLNSQLPDGRYLMKCTITWESKKKGKQLKLLFKPFYKPKASGGHDLIYGSPYGIIISSDSWFQLYDPKTGDKGEMTKFAPMVTLPGGSGYDGSGADDEEIVVSPFVEGSKDDRVRITINKIEDEHGEVIWENPDFNEHEGTAVSNKNYFKSI